MFGTTKKSTYLKRNLHTLPAIQQKTVLYVHPAFFIFKGHKIQKKIFSENRENGSVHVGCLFFIFEWSQMFNLIQKEMKLKKKKRKLTLFCSPMRSQSFRLPTVLHFVRTERRWLVEAQYFWRRKHLV